MQVTDLYRYLKCHSSAEVYRDFTSANQLTGLSISGTLDANWLNKRGQQKLVIKF